LLTVSNSEIMEVQGGKEDCKLLWSTVAQWELEIVCFNLTSIPLIKKGMRTLLAKNIFSPLR
jgi:hypothetical protein